MAMVNGIEIKKLSRKESSDGSAKILLTTRDKLRPLSTRVSCGIINVNQTSKSSDLNPTKQLPSPSKPIKKCPVIKKVDPSGTPKTLENGTGDSRETPRSELYAGEELYGENNFLRSPNGRYEAVFTSQGAVEVYLTEGKSIGDRSVIIHNRRLIRGRAKDTPVQWKMNDQGDLVAAADGVVLFSTDTRTQVTDITAKSLRRLAIRDDGNVILYDGDNVIWKTTTGEQSHWSIQFLYTFGSNMPGLGLLKQGSTIYNGDYLAKLENNGRLCIYQFERDLNGTWKCDKCVWSTNIPIQTKDHIEPYRLFVEPHGDVVIKDGQNIIVWRTNTKDKIRKQPAVLELSDDGKLQLKDGNSEIVWVSNDHGLNDK